MSIEIIDDFLENPNEILFLCKNSRYTWGQADKPGKPKTGMICKLQIDCPEIEKMLQKIFELKPKFKTRNLNRIYINCFAPSEQPYFHEDGFSGTTMLYYSSEKYDLDENGETQFLGHDDIIYGIRPKPNRLVIFDANITHRATAFRNSYRFTVAFKFLD
jgi:hypothetical protein